MEKEKITEDFSVQKSLTVVFVLSTQDEKVQRQCDRAVKHLQEQGIRSEIRTEDDLTGDDRKASRRSGITAKCKGNHKEDGSVS